MATKWNAPSRYLQPFILIVPLSVTVRVTIVLVLQQLKLHALHKRRHHIVVPFLFQFYLASKLSLSFEIVDLKVSAWYIRKMSLLNVCSSSINCQSTRCVSADDDVFRDVDVLGTKTVFINHNR
jgi:hypothetical protein